MRITYQNLRPACFADPGVLLRKTPERKLKQVSAFLKRRHAELTTPAGDHFDLRWDNSESRQNYMVTAHHGCIMCGFALFETSTFSEGIRLLVADLHRLRTDFPMFDMEAPERTGMKYHQHFRGIGTTLTALSLHLAAHLDLPLMRIRYDDSVHLWDSGRNFYEELGFVSAPEVNNALRGKNIKRIATHQNSSKIFYLNGILDGKMDFVIPGIDIGRREETS